MLPFRVFAIADPRQGPLETPVPTALFAPFETPVFSSSSALLRANRHAGTPASPVESFASALFPSRTGVVLASLAKNLIPILRPLEFPVAPAHCLPISNSCVLTPGPASRSLSAQKVTS